MTKYFVVKFPEEQNTLAVVPDSWLENGNCAWPPGNTKAVTQFARCHVLPEQTWKWHKATVVCESKSYERASNKLEKYRYDSDLNMSTDVDLPITKKQPASYTYAQESCNKSSSCATTCADNQEILKQILRSVQNLTHTINEHSTVLQDLTHKVSEISMALHNSAGCQNEELPAIDYLPLRTVDEVTAFNEKLENNDEMRKLVKYLGLLGGRDEKEATRRILVKIFVHDVALQLTWARSEKKRSLQDLHNIHQLIAASIRQNKQFDRATQLSVNDTIKRWFRTANDREGGRIKRKMKTVDI